MWIKDLWDRILANFKKEGDTPVEEPVMELKPENAPEPVPERKTSDEMIIEMAQSVSSDRTEADAAAGEEPADEAERSAAWEIHEDTDPADAAEEAENGAGKLATELAHRIPGGPDKAVYLACDTDKREVRTAAGALAESLKEKGINAQAGRPAAGDEAYEALLASDAVVVVETMNVSGALALKDLLGVCERNSLPVLGCVTLTDVSKY